MRKLDLKALKQVNVKGNTGFIIFLLFINIYVLMSLHNFGSRVPYKNISELFVDGTNFALIANLFGTFLNFVLFFMTFVITFFLVIMAIIIFNKLYFTSVEKIEMGKRTKDIKMIISLISAFSVGLLIISNRNILIIFVLLYYLPFPLMVYFLTKHKIKKSFSSDSERR